MLDKSKLAPTSAHPAIHIAASAFAEVVRKCEWLLFETAQRLYDSHVEKAQMRLAPTRATCKSASGWHGMLR